MQILSASLRFPVDYNGKYYAGVRKPEIDHDCLHEIRLPAFSLAASPSRPRYHVRSFFCLFNVRFCSHTRSVIRCSASADSEQIQFCSSRRTYLVGVVEQSLIWAFKSNRFDGWFSRTAAHRPLLIFGTN